ncbi:RNA-directed DNA polymerase, eukaryota, reverse transcriptase zinc-binding domain protein, partial [Tanacetum coccineum]
MVRKQQDERRASGGYFRGVRPHVKEYGYEVEDEVASMGDQELVDAGESETAEIRRNDGNKCNGDMNDVEHETLNNNIKPNEKLDSKPTMIENGNEFVIFDEESVNDGNAKWKLTICGHFVANMCQFGRGGIGYARVLIEVMFCIVETIQEKTKLFYSFVYATNHDKKRSDLYREISSQKKIVNGRPWILLGDFNGTLHSHEHYVGGSMITQDMAMKRLNWKNGNLFTKILLLKDKLKEWQSKIDNDPFNTKLREEEAIVLKECRETMFLGNECKIQPIEDCDQMFFKKLNEVEAFEMIQDVTDDKRNMAMFDIDNDKAPGSDGFTSCLFKKVIPGSRADKDISNPEKMGLLEFIKTADPWKVQAVEVQKKDNQVKLLESTSHCFMPLVTPAAGGSSSSAAPEVSALAKVEPENAVPEDTYLDLTEPDADLAATRPEKVATTQPGKYKRKRLVKQSDTLPAKQLRKDHLGLATCTSGKTLVGLRQLIARTANILVYTAATTGSDDSFYELPALNADEAKRWYVPRWNITNDSPLADGFSCRTAARQICLESKVRSRAEHELEFKEKLKGRYDAHGRLLEEKDLDILRLKSLLAEEAERA